MSLRIDNDERVVNLTARALSNDSVTLTGHSSARQCFPYILYADENTKTNVGPLHVLFLINDFTLYFCIGVG